MEWGETHREGADLRVRTPNQAPLDDLGVRVPLPKRPTRVVSLVPSLTEAVAETVPGVLVGATDWCTHPAALDVARIGGPKTPDLDAIVRLRPNLVVADQEENRREDVETLRSKGIPVWVTRIRSLDEAATSLERLFAEAFGTKPTWSEAARAVWAESPVRPGLRVAVPVWRDPWLWVGSDTFAHDLLTRLGWTNVGALLGPRYPHAELDAVIALAPDVVLLPDEPYPFDPSDIPEEFASVPTVPLPGRPLFWFGPAMVQSRGIIEGSAGAS